MTEKKDTSLMILSIAAKRKFSRPRLKSKVDLLAHLTKKPRDKESFRPGLIYHFTKTGNTQFPFRSGPLILTSRSQGHTCFLIQAQGTGQLPRNPQNLRKVPFPENSRNILTLISVNPVPVPEPVNMPRNQVRYLVKSWTLSL